jgi:hypothetical protein
MRIDVSYSTCASVVLSTSLYKPYIRKELKCYVDADFPGGWSQADPVNAENVLLCTGYVIMYTNCPILWVSQLQTKLRSVQQKLNILLFLNLFGMTSH